MSLDQPGSLIFQRFGAIVNSNQQPEDSLERLKREGTPLFTIDDIKNASDDLVKMFRSLCVTENITLEYFTEKYKLYVIMTLGKSSQSASNNKVNILKMLKDDKLSWRKFRELTQLVLGYDTTNMVMTFNKKNHKQIKIEV